MVERWTARDLHDESLLRVVPNGTSAPLLTVFGTIGLDPARLGTPTETGLVLLTELLPSYDLSA